MSISSALDDLNNAILDLQQADYNTYERPVKKIAAALDDPELAEINQTLRDQVDFEDFIANSHDSIGLAGSSKLNWPVEKEHELGLTLHLIEKAGENPDWLQQFAQNWYYDGNKTISHIRKLNRSVLIPFSRDYKNFIEKSAPTPIVETPAKQRQPERKKPAWLFWVEAIAAILALLLVILELAAAIVDDNSPLAPIIKRYSFFTEPAICDPNIQTLEELDLCLSRGGVEP